MIAALLLGWLAHELGHWLALRALGFRPRLRNRWLLGVALEVDAACQGWREGLAALAGPAANLLLLPLCRALGWESGFAANFVLAAVNLLPFLPLDGGKALRGLLAGGVGWLAASRWLLLWGQAAGLAFAGVIWYFGLACWLLPLALWLWLLARQEERQLPFLLSAALAAGQGQRLRPRRLVRIRRDMRLHQLVRLFAPGWRDIVCWQGRLIPGDRITAAWLAGQGGMCLSELTLAANKRINA